MQAGFPETEVDNFIVKLPELRALIVGRLSVVLQVTLSLAPRLASNVRSTWLFAVTAEVLTTTVKPLATTTLPAIADPHEAGDEVFAQLPEVDIVVIVVCASVCVAPRVAKVSLTVNTGRYKLTKPVGGEAGVT